MADRKITDLTALAAGSQATGDLVTVVDVSEAAAADKNKKMTMENLFKGIPGNVGVGVSSPAAKLEVQGAATSSAIAAHIKAGDGGSTVGLIVDGDSESGDVLLKARSNSSASPSDSDTKFIIQGDGSIGIGTASLSTTGFNRVLRIKSSTSAAGIFAEAPDTSSWLGLYGGTGTGDSAALLYPDTGSFRIGSTSAVGTTGFSEKLRIDSSGRVGIGESSPDRLLHLKAASNTAYSGGSDTADYNFLKIENTTDDKSAGIFFQIGGNGEAAITAIEASDGATDIAFQNRGGGTRSEKMRLDSSGRLLIGTPSSRTVGGISAPLHVEGIGAGESSITLIRNKNGGTHPPYLFFGKSRSDSVGGTTIVQNGDLLGYLGWQGADGNDLDGTAAAIQAKVDGSPGSNNMPGKLELMTTSSGNSPTARITLFPGGKVRAPGVYAGTTTGGAAVYVESDGDLLRYTSSLKYKTDVETIEDARADAILNCRPVWYRSKCENDIKTEGAEKSDWGWYGFIAEEVAEIEPRLVSWATKDAVRQEDGSVESVERDPANYEAEGIRYDNFVPLLVNLAKRQQSTIEALEARIAALEG